MLLVIPALAVPGPISDLFPAVDLAATGIGVVAVSIAAGMLAALVLDSRKKASA